MFNMTIETNLFMYGKETPRPGTDQGLVWEKIIGNIRRDGSPSLSVSL